MADTFKRGAHPLDLQLGVLAQGPAHRARHRRDEPVHHALGARAVALASIGERLLPVGTLYDPFIYRGADALNYACYQDARFLLVATPSGITLAPEGGAHQSIGTPLIGMAQDGLAAFEPAFVDELAVIMAWAFDYMQRDGEAEPDERAGRATRPAARSTCGCRPGRSTSRARTMTPSWRSDIVDGAYWLRRPGPNARSSSPIPARWRPRRSRPSGLMAEDRRDVGLLAITSADRLNAGWTAAQRARERGDARRACHVERLLADAAARLRRSSP